MLQGREEKKGARPDKDTLIRGLMRGFAPLGRDGRKKGRIVDKALKNS